MKVLVFLNAERGLKTLKYLSGRGDLSVSAIIRNNCLIDVQSKKFKLKHVFKVDNVNSLKY